jgi:predicted transcriptional regulator|tara:strand:+ start:1803 stop:2216 length:414 start_codon:yes stop_codon:yes gene_type:complete
MANYETAASRIEVCKKLKKFLAESKVSQTAFANRLGINTANISNYIHMNHLPGGKNAEAIIDAIETWHQVKAASPAVVDNLMLQDLKESLDTLGRMVLRAEQAQVQIDGTVEHLSEIVLKLSEQLDRSEAKTYLSAV